MLEFLQFVRHESVELFRIRSDAVMLFLTNIFQNNKRESFLLMQTIYANLTEFYNIWYVNKTRVPKIIIDKFDIHHDNYHIIIIITVIIVINKPWYFILHLYN